MTGTGHDGEVEANGKTWAENRYLYEWELVAGPDAAGKQLSEVVGAANMPTETTVYYALYESDRDKIKSKVEVELPEGAQPSAVELPEQQYGEPVTGGLDPIPSFGNYEFDGLWTEPVEGGTEYFDENGKPVGTWQEPGTDVTLYAQWKYKVVLDGNVHGFENSNGEMVEASIDWSSIPSTGEGFKVVEPEDGSAPYIEARYGAPIPLPKASREGYGDTRAWGLTAGASSEAGKAGWVMRLTGDFYSAKESDKAQPDQADFLPNGASGENPGFAPNADHSVVLYANWLWADDVPDADKPQPSGGKSSYKVRLKAAYEVGEVAYDADWADDALLEGIEYDSAIPDSKLAALSAPRFVSATGYERLVFKGFYTMPNVPESEAGSGFAGVQLIAPSEDDDSKLEGVDEPMRLVPDATGEVVLYALWALPVTNVAFHLNEAGLEELVSYKDALVDPSALAQHDGAAYIVSVETNEPSPSIAIGAPSNGNYEFNGWWTHPYLERGDSVQYYDASNQPVRDEEGQPIAWAPYNDTVLYAHWRYTVEFDVNATGPSAGTAEVRHKAPDMPMAPEAPEDADWQVDAWGNRYFYEDLAGDDLRITRIEAVAGAPLKLPYATDRKTAAGEASGYDDTCQWATSAVVDEAHPVLPVDAGGFTLASAAEGAAKGKPAIAPGAGGTVKLYADWTGMAHDFEVLLEAGDRAVNAGGSTWTDETLTGVEFDKTLRESGVGAVGVPLRDGYTFTGFFTEAEGGEKYIEPDGEPVANKPWAVAAAPSASGERKVTLYAQYVQDSYKVVYDLSLPAEGNQALAAKTPGRQAIDGSEPAVTQGWTVGAAQAHEGGAFPVAQTAPVTAKGLFFRNGYDFAGWYWVDDSDAENPQAVDASDASGTSRGAFAPSLAWQQAHKGGLNADGTAKAGTITLYAAWTPKVYGLVFELGYQEQEDVALPNDSMAGMTAPNKVASRGGTYYYEVAYEQQVTPFFEGAGDAAVPAVPTDEPYAFVNWKVKDGLGTGDALFGDDDDTATTPTLQGAFMPAYPLSTRAVGNGGAPATITFRGQWKSPEAVELRLSAGEADRGQFATAGFGYLDPSIFDAGASSERQLVFHNVDYQRTFDLLSARSPYRPQAKAGYTLVGFALTNAAGELLAADGTPLGHGPYDGAGELRSDVATVGSLSKLTSDTYAVAVYSRNKMMVELDMSEVPQHAGYGGYQFYSLVGGEYQPGWVIDGAASASTLHAFDVTSAAFRLPDDVVVPGYTFTGWQRVEPASAGDVPDEFDPADIAANPNLARQVFKPTFAEKAYEVSFLPNYAAGHGQGEPRKATIDFDGRITDAGDFAGLAGFAVGEVLPMASVPEPDAAAKDDSHTGSDAADENHYHSYPFSLWRVGNAYASQADPQERLAGAEVSSAEWNAWIARFAAAVPGTKNAVESLPVYAVWQPAISAVLPLRADVALDPNTGSVSIPDKTYGVYGIGLLEGEQLEVAELRYQSVTGDADDPVAGENALAVEGAPISLTVFANAAAVPTVGEPTVDENGIVRGDYGKAAGNPLLIDLSASNAAFGKAELEAHGFAPFTTAGNRLMMHYGLDLDGVPVAKLRELAAKLPGMEGELTQAGWTKAAVPVARLFYTVQIAG